MAPSSRITATASPVASVRRGSLGHAAQPGHCDESRPDATAHRQRKAQHKGQEYPEDGSIFHLCLLVFGLRHVGKDCQGCVGHADHTGAGVSAQHERQGADRQPRAIKVLAYPLAQHSGAFGVPGVEHLHTQLAAGCVLFGHQVNQPLSCAFERPLLAELDVGTALFLHPDQWLDVQH